MDEFEPSFIAELVGQIYEAAYDARRWDDLLTLLERLHPDSRITLFTHDSGGASDALTVHKNFPAEDLRAYQEHYVKNSPHVARASRVPVGRAIHSESVIEDSEFHTTEHYNDFVRPRRLGYHATGIVLERAPRRMTALSIANRENDPDQRGRQLKLLDLLAPHLVRAFRLHHTLAVKEASGEAAQAALDRWAHAAFVLNAAGRVIWYNGAAEALLQHDGLSLGRDGQLLSADEARTRALELAARKCAALSTMGDADVSAAELEGIALPRPTGTPLRAMIWPLPYLDAPAAPGPARATSLLVILDPDRAQRTPVGWIARQYGLSPSEQRLAEAIVNGVPLAMAAEEFGIQLSTARQRLKDIQAKTQCRRQTDLIRLAFSLPRVRVD